MAPHVVEFLDGGPVGEGILKIIAGTEHTAGEKDTPQAKYAHSIDFKNPNLCEVGDDCGQPCNPFKQSDADDTNPERNSSPTHPDWIGY